MDKEILKNILLNQHAIKLPKPLFARESFQELLSLKKNKQIIVITGIRRCGKSTLLQMLRQHEKQADYYINFDDDRLVQFQLEDFQMLYELFIELYGLQKVFYFDEIQNIPEWERFIRRLHDEGYKIYITGSNANLFSEELGTRLTGRYIPISLYPYSFREYLSQEQLDTDKPLTTVQKGQIKRSFSKFIQKGGVPEYVAEQQIEYLQALYESILYRDIIARYKITHQQVIKELVYYLASNMSKEITFNSLRKLLNVSSPSTISAYCHYLQNSYLCFFVNRYAHSLKKQFQYAKKVYFIDHAMAIAIGFRNSKDHGRVLENVVYLELLRRKYDVYFHQEKKECDFLIRANGKIQQAIQVCSHIEDPLLLQREISGLEEAIEMYDVPQGIILTEDTESKEQILVHGQHRDIQIIPVWKWLLSEYE